MHTVKFAFVVFALVLTSNASFAQDDREPRAAPDTKVLNNKQWKQLDDSVERALEWLISQQKADGSFETIELGQPGVTAFCLMAFLAQGESPIDGKYQRQLSKAVEYIAAQQKPNGLIALNAPSAAPVPRGVIDDMVESTSMRSKVGIAVVYNHAISSLALCEAYGQCSPEQTTRLAPVIEKAISGTLEMQQWNTKEKQDIGGWRYLDRRIDGPAGSRFYKRDSDLSVTGWQLMFLRSARNAGFDVSEESIDAAVKFVDRCFLKSESRRVHGYLIGKELTCTRAMAGAGILAMAHAGKHDCTEAVESAEWLLKHDFKDYNAKEPVYGYRWLPDRYHYGAVICSQAMYQLGGKYWKTFFPPLVDALLNNQKPDGAWPPEKSEEEYGSCYSTSLSILSLSVPNQMLPIFQR